VGEGEGGGREGCKPGVSVGGAGTMADSRVKHSLLDDVALDVVLGESSLSLSMFGYRRLLFLEETCTMSIS
jgi:hypothetical protein